MQGWKAPNTDLFFKLAYIGGAIVMACVIAAAIGVAYLIALGILQLT